MVTSFSSKSELALNLSTDGQRSDLHGLPGADQRARRFELEHARRYRPDQPGSGCRLPRCRRRRRAWQVPFAKTNAYSGNNGRAAILNSAANVLYTAGNAGNGANPQPDGVIVGAGAQILDSQVKALVAQKPGDPTPVGSFSVTQLGYPADKVGKDTNFRGLTIFDNVVYYTKGSGGNGINTVYFVDTTGQACPNGVGLPDPNAVLPTAPINYDASVLQTLGVTPYNMCVLNGFPTNLAKKTTSFPFGIWFANPTTLYVADEGNGTNTYSSATNTYTAAAAAEDRRPAEVGAQRRHLDARLHAAGGPRSGRAVHGRRLPDRQ